jgi:hypothetical protein
MIHFQSMAQSGNTFFTEINAGMPQTFEVTRLICDQLGIFIFFD